MLRAIVLFFVLASAAPPEFDHGVDLPTTRPLNIAHRGSCGRLPEHTREAYQLAIDEGADVIECDVTLTKDLQLICSHEAWLSATTNIAEVFGEDRMNAYFVIDSLREITDYFSVDFTLEELKQVRTKQRNSRRDPNFDGLYEMTSLEEYIQIAQNAGRPVGIYPETKDPIWTNSLDILQEANTTFEDLLVDVLHQYGYQEPRDPCFIQSFNENSLRYMSERTDLPLIMLGVSALASDDRLDSLAEFCYGIGPSKSSIVNVGSDGRISQRTDLIERAHARGLRVHPYTARHEHNYLPYDYGNDPVDEYEDFLDLGADGLFTDFPHTYHRFLENSYAVC
jgi:glycerophosphoryl diester phosphodiesterase